MERMNLAVAGSLYDVRLQELGVAILSEHLRAAAMVFASATTSLYARKERQHQVEDSVAFVKGTGLHVVIEQFHLNLDPTQLQETFFSWAEHRRTVHRSPSSSVIIPIGSLNGV